MPVNLGNEKAKLYLGDIEIAGEGGGASLNIAYGINPPSDTTKLWVKTTAPVNTKISFNLPTIEYTTPTAIGSFTETYKYARGVEMVGNKIYYFGGNDSPNGPTNGTSTKSIKSFDIYNNTYSNLGTVTDAANGIVDANVIAIGDMIYSFGGKTYSNGWKSVSLTFSFNTKTNTYSKISTSHSASSSGVANVGNKIYLFGGQTQNNAFTANISLFDTISKTYNYGIGSLGTGKSGVSTCAIGNKIYLFGGAFTDGTYTDDIQVFDTTTNTTETLSAKLNIATSHMGVLNIGNKIYLFGGCKDLGSSTHIYGGIRKIQVFDTTTNTVNTLSQELPFDVGRAKTKLVGDKVYLYGIDGNDAVYTTAIDLEVLENDILIAGNQNKNLFNAINTDEIKVEIGVDTVYKGNASNKGELVDTYLYKDGNWTNINTGETN